jgi:hypothetical protein
MRRMAMPHLETPDGMVVDFEIEKLGRDVLPHDYEQGMLDTYGPQGASVEGLPPSALGRVRDEVARRVWDDMRSVARDIAAGRPPRHDAVRRLRAMVRLKGSPAMAMACLWVRATCRFAGGKAK